ncbi:MAG: hypothetical protein ACKV2V_13380 [Blastocatellia bacterium]
MAGKEVLDMASVDGERIIASADNSIMVMAEWQRERGMQRQNQLAINAQIRKRCMEDDAIRADQNQKAYTIVQAGVSAGGGFPLKRLIAATSILLSVMRLHKSFPFPASRRVNEQANLLRLEHTS